MSLTCRASSASTRASCLLNARSQFPSREPLYFLYPRWSSTASLGSKRAQSEGVLHNAVHATYSHDRKRVNSRGISSSDESKHYRNGAVAASRSKMSLERSQTASDSGVSSNVDPGGVGLQLNVKTTLGPQGVKRPKKNNENFAQRIPSDRSRNPSTENHDVDMLRTYRLPQGTAEAAVAANENTINSFDEDVGWEPGIPVRKVFPYNVDVETTRKDPSSFQLKNVEVRRERDERKLRNQILKDKGPLSSDWRIPLKLLLANYVEKRPREGERERIWIPEQVLIPLIGHPNENTWLINVKNRCEIHVLPQDQSRGVLRQCILKGSTLSIEKTKDYIATVWAELSYSKPGFFERVPFVPSSLLASLEEDTSEVPMIRSVWADIKGHTHARRIEHIPKPPSWSVKTFAEYIETLTLTSVSPGYHRHLYGMGEKHHVLAKEMIKDAFLDQATQDYLSSAALNIALRFLLKHRFLPTARTLCLHYEKAELSFITETFNIMLRAAAREKDVYHYTYTLNLMVRHNVNPDHRAWAAFLYTLDSLEVKMVVLGYMKSQGLLENPENIQDIIPPIVESNFAPHVDRDGTLHSYVTWMDCTYGRAWFGVVAGNQILKGFATRGRLDAIPKVINLFRNRDIRMDVKSLNAILFLCRDLGAVPMALEVLQRLDRDFQVLPDALSYWTLFEMAWSCRLVNVCRVIWSYACLAGLAYNQMLTLLRRSVCSQPEDKGVKLWALYAAQIIIGIDDLTARRKRHLLFPPDVPLRRLTAPAPADFQALTVGPTPSSNPPTQPRTVYFPEMVRNLIESDLQAVLKYRPLTSKSIHLDLRRAYAMDMEWEWEDITQPATREWMWHDAITVGLKLTTEPRTA